MRKLVCMDAKILLLLALTGQEGVAVEQNQKELKRQRQGKQWASDTVPPLGAVQHCRTTAVLATTAKTHSLTHRQLAIIATKTTLLAASIRRKARQQENQVT